MRGVGYLWVSGPIVDGMIAQQSFLGQILIFILGSFKVRIVHLYTIIGLVYSL